MVGYLDTGDGGSGSSHRGGPPIQVDMAFMIDLYRVMHPSGSSSREHRGVVDCRCDDAGTHPAATQGQSSDGSLTCVYSGQGEDHLIRSPSHGGCDYLSRLIQSLRGKSTWAVQAHWIAPPSLLSLEPSLARFFEHGLARRAVQEDFGEGMRHPTKLALF